VSTTDTPTRTDVDRPQRWVGRPLDRRDGPAKTTGAARYSAEYPPEDLAHAALVHATITRGRISTINAEQASAVPGVVAVITHENAPRMKATAAQNPTRGNLSSSATNVTYLNTDEIYWNGQPVAVVVAETLDIARHAASLVRIKYEEWPAAVDFDAELGHAKKQPSNPMLRPHADKGDAHAALAAAEFAVDLRFTTPPLHHNAIEPHATIAVWSDDLLTVYEGTQYVTGARNHLAKKFGVNPSNVRVISKFVGGAFGGKSLVWPGTILAVLAARVTRRPVKLVLTREGVFRAVGGRTPTAQRVALGATADGTLTSLIHTSVVLNGRIGGYAEQVTSPSRHLYASPNLLLRQDIVPLDTLTNTIMRAPGEAVGTFALESAIDELAHHTGVDPIELRARNEPAVSPADGNRFSHRRIREAYGLGAERFGWAERTPEPGSMRDGHHLVGMGVATAFHPAFQFPADLTVRLSADGTVLVRCSFHEMGMGAATAFAQVTADLLGVPVAAVSVDYGDTDLPPGPGAGGSGQTASVTQSLLAACERLKRSLHARARRDPRSPLHRTHYEQLETRNGGLYLQGSASVGARFEAILERAGAPDLEVRIGSDRRIGRAVGQLRFLAKLFRDQRRWVKAASGAQFCEVRVDPDTMEVRVTRWVGVFDIGTVVNLKTASSQLRGGIVWGIGLALTEATLVDPRNGRIMNPSLAEYHVPVHADVPPIDVHILDDPDPTMPLGVLGCGEAGITGAAAAVANAIHHATGKRVTDLPITIDKLL
jgi:xanthine dehydrogenase YagR molybdenum-binding subunit